jgi:tRNA threonylcarbamoyl adenosine modification protein YeaZ
MKVLGIETSTYSGSVAVVEGERILGEFTINIGPTHSQKLLPMIDSLLDAVRVGMDEIGGIAVSRGPGYFTALRVGISTAKGLSLSLGKPIVGVDSLEVLARNVPCEGKTICPVIDAKRGEVYAAIFEYRNGEFCRTTEDMLLTPAALVSMVTGRVVFVGDTHVIEPFVVGSALVDFAPSHLNIPRASFCAFLGSGKLIEGVYDNAATLSPYYMRRAEGEQLF